MGDTMNNAPERIAREAAGAFAPTMSMDGVADAVTSALATAGWLRLSPMSLDAKQQIAALTMQRDDALAEVARLTRERDEARKQAERWQEEARTYALNADYWRAQSATQSSPEVLAVVEAAKAWYREVSGVQFTLPMYRNLSNAVAAMITVERKAEPKPSTSMSPHYWTTEQWPSLAGAFGVNRGNQWHGPFAPDVCRALAIALNAADAAGRKS